jgi:SAM-dependent methyltransferase
MRNEQKYTTYLAKRSIFALIYRNFILYPILCKYLCGETLDVGCGIGDMLKFRPGTVGVDVNTFNVDFCKSRGLAAEVMKVDELSYADKSFNSVLLDNVLEHIKSPRKLMMELNRVLVMGGVLLVGVPGNLGFMSDPDHKFFYDEKALESLAKDHGFVIKKIFYMPFLLRSKWLNDRLRQYCIYSVLIKTR